VIGTDTALCMVIGDPVAHSLSPLIHNAAYRAAGAADRFVFIAARVEAGRLRAALQGVRALGIRGVSCTLPHKEAVLAELDELDPLAQRIGAVNTVVNAGGRLMGYNTDSDGVAAPLARRTPLAGKRVLILGAGGAARAAAFALSAQRAAVTLANRSLPRAQALAGEIGAAVLDWRERSSAHEYDIVFNATSIGMRSAESPLARGDLRAGQIVFDAVYTPYDTALLRAARAAGAETVHGTEMFVEQAARQFLLYTGIEAPRAAMEDALHQSGMQHG